MYSLKDEDKKIMQRLYIICMIFFIFCVLTILIYGNSTLLGNLANPDNDDVKFIRSAEILAHTGKYVYHDINSSTVFMMPGLSYTLAFFIIIFQKLSIALTLFRIFQAVLQSLCLILVFLIARKVFNSNTALLAVLLNAAYLPEIWVSNLILTETLFKFFVLNLIYICLYAIEEKKTSYYVIGGITWGIAALYRPTIATFPIVILVLWIMKKYSIKEILKYTAAASAAFCIILSPWWIRNYTVFHRFIPLTEATGNPFLQGTYINYNQNSRLYDGLDYSQFKYPAKTELENNNIEMSIGIYRLKELIPKNPLAYLYWYTIGKTACQIGTVMYWKSFLHIHPAFVFIYHYMLIICSTMGIKYFLSAEKRTIMISLLFDSIIYFIAVYLPFYAFSRYFYPVMPIVIIFAAAFICNRFQQQLNP